MSRVITRFLPIFLLLISLGACSAPGFRAEVSRFHQLGPPGGERIRIVPTQGQEQGLEFENYAALLGDFFSDYGYLPAADREPQIIARFGFEAKPDPNFHASGGPIIGLGLGGYGGHVGGSVSTAIDTSDRDRLYYLHSIRLVLEDAGNGERIFEGTASGHALGEYWPGMMPKLLKALFTDWPGRSGTTETIKLEQQ